MESANRRPAPGAGFLPQPTNTAVMGGKDASSSRQPRPSGVGATYSAVLAGSVSTFQPNGTFKPTAMDSDSYEPGVSTEISERHMSPDLSGPLSDTPDGTTDHAHVANAFFPAGQRPKRKPIFIAGVTPVASEPCCEHPALKV